MKRYKLIEGIIIRRKAMTNGDVVVTLLSPDSKFYGVAVKGKLLGGNIGKLSLFHDVNLQYYKRSEESLMFITQVELNGALPRLVKPEIYPYAHILAELTDKLTPDTHSGESYEYLTSSLRGLDQHADPEKVAIIFSWKLLGQAGLAPRLNRCTCCGKKLVEKDFYSTFDVSAGGLSCQECDRGIKLSAQTINELIALQQKTVRQVLELDFTERNKHWLLLKRYIAYHVGEVKSLSNLILADFTPSS